MLSEEEILKARIGRLLDMLNSYFDGDAISNGEFEWMLKELKELGGKINEKA